MYLSDHPQEYFEDVIIDDIPLFVVVNFKWWAGTFIIDIIDGFPSKITLNDYSSFIKVPT